MQTSKAAVARRRAAAAVLAAALLAAAAPDEEVPRLLFRDAAGVERSLDRDALVARCDARVVTVDDPYYGRPKRYRACPLDEVLRAGLGGLPEGFADAEVLLLARDGYVRPASGAQLLEPGGFVAFADAERPGWEPIDRRGLDPGPFYVVWTGADQSDPHTTPWPYQLAAVEVVDFEARYPHVRPRGVPDGSPALRGFAIFRRECIACHAVNGEGGTVGPDLNVPRSIVEYRPEEQIKAYVRDPGAFRHTTMPAHPHLSDADLDALVAYFRAMRERKHDPRADGNGGPP